MYETREPHAGSPLTAEGRQLADMLAVEVGVALTDDEMAEALTEAHERIGPHDGNHGCMGCHTTGTDLRYGYCFDCVMGAHDAQ